MTIDKLSIWNPKFVEVDQQRILFCKKTTIKEIRISFSANDMTNCSICSISAKEAKKLVRLINKALIYKRKRTKTK